VRRDARPVTALDELTADLAAEHADLDGLVAGLDEAALDTPTPAEGWRVRDQISHLAWFDREAVRAAVDPEGFTAALPEALADEAYTERAVVEGRSLPGPELLASWRAARGELVEALAGLDPSTRVPWYGPPMSAASFATARLMETWAHGQDVADALGVERAPTDRLRHVAFLGVRALPNSYRVRGLPVPEAPVRVELDAPSGVTWVWGDEGTTDVVRGPALDFCLVVTQRRHVDDTHLVAEGPVAVEWLRLAQAFAGPAGPGRPPRSRS
jgi:uncharacterized protein (TIGR03084 family)